MRHRRYMFFHKHTDYIHQNRPQGRTWTMYLFQTHVPPLRTVAVASLLVRARFVFLIGPTNIEQIGFTETRTLARLLCVFSVGSGMFSDPAAKNPKWGWHETGVHIFSRSTAPCGQTYKSTLGLLLVAVDTTCPN